MKPNEEAQLVAIRAQAIAIATACDALLGEGQPPQCCAKPEIVSEDTYSGPIKHCRSCGKKQQPTKEG